MNRRQFLAIAGGGVIVAAGAGGWWASTRTPTKALAPWGRAGSAYDEPRRKALSYAILAPNPHNIQPWLVDLSTDDTVTLKVDTDRMLPHTDPFNRQITIGLGCFLEVMTMAAAEDGWAVDLDLFPEGSDPTKLDERPVAVARFRRDESVRKDPLFTYIPDRRSLKEPYDTARPVSDEQIEVIVNAARNPSGTGATNDPEQVAVLRDLTRKALEVELDTPRTYKESVDLFRIGKAEIEANPDGIDFSGPFMEGLGLVGMMTRESALDRSSTGYIEGRKAVLANADTAMAHVWQVTRGNTRADQIAAGRDWVRLNLAATAVGVGTQPLSQALQEYEEMKPHYDRLHAMLARDGGTVQMLARLGFAAPVPQSPRWPLEAKIISA